MAATPVDTVEGVKERILGEFPRQAAQFEDIVDAKLDAWISELSDVFPFWFLTPPVGEALRPLFPISDLTAVTSMAPSVGGCWLDSCWLRTTAGQAVYDVYVPLEDQEADNPTWWRKEKVRQVDFCYEFSKEGTFLYNLPVPEYEDALLFSSFRTQQRPTQLTWRTIEDRTQFVLNPTPDKAYLYVIQFSIRSPKSYLDPSSGYNRNRFITHASEAVVAKGCLEAAKFFDEMELVKYWRNELYGTPEEAQGGVSALTGGILGRLRKVTISRPRHSREQLKAYGSLAQATGLGNTRFSNKEQIWGGRGRRGRWW